MEEILSRKRRRYTVHVFTYVTKEQADVLEGRAWAQGLTVSAMVRKAIVDALSLPPEPMREPFHVEHSTE